MDAYVQMKELILEAMKNQIEGVQDLRNNVLLSGFQGTT